MGVAAAEKADAKSALSFPTGDAPSATPEGGVHSVVAVSHQPVPGTPTACQLLIDGLQAAYQPEASARDWLPPLSAAVTALPSRQCLGRLREETGYNLEHLQRALACVGASHDHANTPFPPTISAGSTSRQPTGALFDLSASVAVRADRATVLSTNATLEKVASAAGLTRPLPFLRACASTARKKLDEPTRLCTDELVPAAA